MNSIHSQIRRARRRLILGRFLAAACRSLGLVWSLAAIGILARALWVTPWESQVWDAAWLIGSTVLGLASAALIAAWTAPSLLKAATEIDTRFGLRERLGSALALPAEVRDTPIGQALLADAESRAEPLDLRDRFAIAPTRLTWLPLLPAAMMAVALFVPAAEPVKEEPQTLEVSAEAHQITTAAKSLKQKLSQQREQAEATGLKDAEELFRKLEGELNDLTKRESLDSKDAMVALNDIKKQLDQRREQLGAPEQLRQALAKLPELQTGPMRELTDAIRQGDFAKAEQQLRSLAEKLRDESLTQEQRDELRNQVESLRDRITQENERTEIAKRQLQQQIDQARAEGRTEDEAKLRQQLTQLESRESQNRPLQELADAMGQAAQSLQEGRTGEAGDTLEALAASLGEMQSDLEEWEGLQDTLESLAQSKQTMRCESCAGGGCTSCQGDQPGQFPGQTAGQGGGRGYGEGIGRDSGDGKNPEEETETGTYETQVRGQPKAGPGIVSGFADGPNRKGVSREEVKSAVLGAVQDQSDPLENQTLPRVERDHAREYFDRLRQGSSRDTP